MTAGDTCARRGFTAAVPELPELEIDFEIVVLLEG